MNAGRGRRVTEGRGTTARRRNRGSQMIRARNLPIVATGALLAATAIGLSAATAHEPRGHPQKMWVGSGGLYVRASVGSYCWSRREGAAICADAAYPIDVRGRLPVQPRDRVT